MLSLVVACFVLGYIAIVFEHPLRLDKSVPALIMGALCWAFVSLGHLDTFDSHHVPAELSEVLLHHLGKTAEILIFLIGAMTIVELIDLHKGFAVITNQIKTTNKGKMLWLVMILAFFLSATLDNLASTIVLVSLLRRLVPNKKERLWFVSMAVIGANAGGAWSPIGDVTTTMLWIGNKVSTLGLVSKLVLPSLACMIIPTVIATRLKIFRGPITGTFRGVNGGTNEEAKLLSSRAMLLIGIGGLIFVPIFKTITHLPPYVGMMLSLGVVWLVSEYIHPEEDFSETRRKQYSAHHALSRIEMGSIIFFLGILMAVSSLESVGALRDVAVALDKTVPNLNIVVIILGVISAIIDNVPLVAGAMGMYTFPLDSSVWHFIAYSAGTGGSMLIIGSAAGVAAMGMERINFIWYMRNVTWLAFIGFAAGIGVFLLMAQITGG